MFKTKLISAALGAGLVIGGVALAQPKKNVSAANHPNLAAAQQLSSEAYTEVTAAQQDNEWDLAGHAAKAKAACHPTVASKKRMRSCSMPNG